MHGGLNKDQLFHKRATALSDALADCLDPAKVKDKSGMPVLHDGTLEDRAVGMVRFMTNQVYAKGLGPFLNIFVPLFIGGIADEEIDPKSMNIINKALDDALHEQKFQAVAYVARNPDDWQTLTDLTSIVYCEERAGKTYYRRQIRTSLIPKLNAVGLWTCKSLPGNTWKVKAGPAQLLFNKYIARRWGRHQAIFFGEYMKKMEFKWKGEE